MIQDEFPHIYTVAGRRREMKSRLACIALSAGCKAISMLVTPAKLGQGMQQIGVRNSRRRRLSMSKVDCTPVEAGESSCRVRLCFSGIQAPSGFYHATHLTTDEPLASLDATVSPTSRHVRAWSDQLALGLRSALLLGFLRPRESDTRSAPRGARPRDVDDRARARLDTKAEPLSGTAVAKSGRGGNTTCNLVNVYS